MNTPMQPLLISLKPCYADLVFEGLKKAELRRRIISCTENRDVFIYVSSPVRELRGGFRVGQVWQGSPEEIWRMVSDLAEVTRRDFDIYFEGSAIAYALEITEVWEYENPAGLNTLRSRFPNFVVPQSWRYAKPEECRSFRNMKRKTKSTLNRSAAAWPPSPCAAPTTSACSLLAAPPSAA